MKINHLLFFTFRSNMDLNAKVVKETILPLLVILFLIISPHAIGQNSKSKTPEWENPQIRKSRYPSNTYYVSYIKKEDIKPKSYNPEKNDQFKNELKQDVSSKIYSTVKYESETRINETSTNGVSTTFDSYTKVESDINISDCYAIKTVYIKKQKALYGLIFVDKKKLGNHYITYFNTNYELLINQMQRYSMEEKSVANINNDLYRFREQNNELKSYISIISISGVAVPSGFSSKVSSVTDALNEIEGSLDMSTIEESIKKAEIYFEDRKYAQALAIYEVVEIKLPNDKRVYNGIVECKRKLEQQYVNKANNYKNQGNYDLAIIEYENLFIKIPEVKFKYEEEYGRIERIAFDRYAKELDNALVNMTIDEVELALQKLERYQYIDQEKYNRYYRKVENYSAEKMYNQAQVDYYEKRYSSAIRTVKKALVYNQAPKYEKLKTQCLEKLYQIELNELKISKPHIFAFQLGGGLQTENNYWNAYSSSKSFSMSLRTSLSAGLFWTYGKHVRIKDSGKDKSRKNLLGFRYTYVFRDKRSQFQDINELELVAGFSKYFLFNMGVSSFYIDPSIQEVKLNALSAGLALRWYMHPFEMQFEFKSYLDENYNLFPVSKISMVIHGKFKRKITRADRKVVRIKVNNQN